MAGKPANHDLQHLFAAGEVVVEGSRGHPRAAHDRIDGHGLPRLEREQLSSDVDEILSPRGTMRRPRAGVRSHMRMLDADYSYFHRGVACDEG